MSNTLNSKSKSGPAIGLGPGADDSNETEAQRAAAPAIAAIANGPDVVSKGGLTSDAAQRQLAKFGPNAMPDTGVNPLAMAIEKFWAPVPWMLEAAIVLELVLGKYVEASIIALLLVFNAALGLFQESRAQATLRGLENSSCHGFGAGRSGEAIARRRGRSRCEAYRRRSSPRSIHAHRRIGAY
jgi:magnesium-transporting ATPase (P-type)